MGRGLGRGRGRSFDTTFFFVLKRCVRYHPSARPPRAMTEEPARAMTDEMWGLVAGSCPRNVFTLELPKVTCVDGGRKQFDFNSCDWFIPEKSSEGNQQRNREAHLKSAEGCLNQMFQPLAKRAANLAREEAAGFSYDKMPDGTDDKTHVLVEEAALGQLKDQLAPLERIDQIKVKVRPQVEPSCMLFQVEPSCNVTSARASQLKDPRYPHLAKMILATRQVGVKWCLTGPSFDLMLQFASNHREALTDAQLSAFLTFSMSLESSVGGLQAMVKTLGGDMRSMGEKVQLLQETVLTNAQAGHDRC